MNPISFLQEHMMSKKKTIPNYTIVDQTSGTHLNTFVMRCDCDGLSTKGKGASKKEAKILAATEMLKLLGFNSNNPSSSHTSAKVNSHCDNKDNSLISHDQGMQKSPMTSVNYVGKLQEFTIKNDGSLPQYNCNGLVGPPHVPKFTTICLYQGIKTEGSASNKKESKNLAAKKMYEKVVTEMQVFLPEIKVESYIDTITNGVSKLQTHESNQTLMQDSIRKANRIYPHLSKTTLIKNSIIDSRPCSEYHTFLKNSCTVKERQIILNLLQDVMLSCKDLLSGNYKMSPVSLLEKALKYLNIELKIVTFDIKTNKYFHGLQLNTNPILSEIGSGMNKQHAEIIAVFQMANTLSMILV